MVLALVMVHLVCLPVRLAGKTANADADLLWLAGKTANADANKRTGLIATFGPLSSHVNHTVFSHNAS